MSDYGRAFEGMVKLAGIGITAIYAMALIVPVGIIALLWWAFHHVSIH